MATVTSEGSRLERLENLALILAKQIDICAKDAADGPKTMPQLSRQYRETIKEIEEIKGMEKTMTKSEKSCRHEKLMGSQTPSDRIVPDYAYTDGPDAVKMLAVGKLNCGSVAE